MVAGGYDATTEHEAQLFPNDGQDFHPTRNRQPSVASATTAFKEKTTPTKKARLPRFMGSCSRFVDLFYRKRVASATQAKLRFR